MQILGKFAGKFAGKIAPKLGFFLGLAFAYAAGDSLANLGATFTRASTATYIDSNGVLQTAASGVPRDGHYIGGVRTLLLEGQRTNSFLNSGTPATHTSPSLVTGSYTLWLVGTGSIAVAAGTATITGAGTATAATPVTFTVTVAGTVTFTVTGSPARAQCENGAFASSYIATAGSAVTRSADSLSFGLALVSQSLTMFAKGVNLGTFADATNPTVIELSDGTYRAFVQGLTNGIRGLVTGGTTVTSQPAATALVGDTAECRLAIDATGSPVAGLSVNGAAESLGTGGGAHAFGNPLTFYVDRAVAGGTGFFAFQSIKIALGVQSLVTMRGL